MRISEQSIREKYYQCLVDLGSVCKISETKCLTMIGTVGTMTERETKRTKECTYW